MNHFKQHEKHERRTVSLTHEVTWFVLRTRRIRNNIVDRPLTLHSYGFGDNCDRRICARLLNNCHNGANDECDPFAGAGRPAVHAILTNGLALGYMSIRFERYDM